ncbi:MAG: porin family protein [Chromatiales bacterium]|nr:porin family protein [Chromatiales bacterium]
MRKSLPFLAAGLLAASPVLANDTPVYFGAGFNITSVELSARTAQGITADARSDTTLGWQLHAGYMFTPNIGLEGRASRTGTLRDRSSTSAGDLFSRVTLDGFTLSAVGELPVIDQLDVFAKLGWTWQSAESRFEIPGVLFDQGKTKDNGFAAGFGLRWHLTRNWAVTGEFEYLHVDFRNSLDEPLRGSFNLEYRF